MKRREISSQVRIKKFIFLQKSRNNYKTTLISQKVIIQSRFDFAVTYFTTRSKIPAAPPPPITTPSLQPPTILTVLPNLKT